MSALGAPEQAAAEATRRWLEKAVIGLNLCPFAKAPYAKGRVRIVVSSADNEDHLLADLSDELQYLYDTDEDEVETTLLVHPYVLRDFIEFNDFHDLAEGAVTAMGFEGEIQVATFHPDYEFADAPVNDPANNTNRSPYPTLHLLRESSIERMVERVEDADDIYRRNIERMRELGQSGWKALWRENSEAASG